MRKRLFYTLSALLLIAVVSLLVIRLVSPLFARTLTCNTWKNMATSQDSEKNTFTSVALLSANDVWIAGRSRVLTSEGDKPLVEHWDGKDWQTLFPLDPGTLDGTINGIAVVSDDDVWVVGSSYADPANAIPLAEHWDGHTWHLLPANSTLGYTSLSSVTALASNNVWAVGETFEKKFYATFIEHWDGSSWKRVSSPNVADENNDLTGISALTASDIWAVGNSKGYQGSQLSLAEHWDGSHWNIVTTPDPSRDGNALLSVAAVSSNDVWSVGASTPSQESFTSHSGYKLALDPPSIQESALIEHWDGQHWQIASFPGLGQYQVLLSITAYSSREVWAAGFYVTDEKQGEVFHGLLEHWDGSAWHATEDLDDQFIAGIATSASSGLWSVGSTFPPRGSSTPVQPIVEECL